MENNQKYIIGAVIVAVAILIGGFIITKSPSAPASGQYDEFAKCTAAKGLTMYGAAWCSHCTAEKNRFGDSFKYVNYVECPDNIQLCTNKGVNGYPTWIDGEGKKHEGEQGLEGIAKITGCELPK
jgi:hypothetical protein